jgi:sortase A
LATLLLAAPAAAADGPPGTIPARSREPVGAAAQSLGHDLGRIQIPSIGVNEEVLAGVDLSVLARGVGHWVGTSWAGGPGNVVLAGHRTTYGAPFADIDLLQTGDVLFISDLAGVAAYRVAEVFVVEPTDMWITHEVGRPIVTLFACHPKGSARYRIVVQGELFEYLIR